MRADWVDRHPNSARALLMAVLDAQMWCDQNGNRREVAQILAKRQWIGAPYTDVVDRLEGNFDYGSGRVVARSPHLMKFWRDHASYPYQSHELWFLTENVRWGRLGDQDHTKLIAHVNREDLWREAAQALGVPAAQIPQAKSRGIERFFDGKSFDPANPGAYLASLAIRRS
jgi:nitrate/nitrite transport system substrate-binding protein